MDLFHLLFPQPARTPRSLSLSQTSQSLLIESVNPIFDRTRCVAQQSPHLWTGHALSYQQDAVQAVIVSRLFRPLYLLLQTPH